MDENVPNKNFFSNNVIVDVFPACYYNNFIIVYNFGNILTMQTQETQNTSNKSCFTASMRSRHSNNKGRSHYSMYLQNSVLYNFGFKHLNFWPSDFCSSTFQKMKAMWRTFVLKCSQNYVFFISDVQYYVPIKLCKAAGSIHLFKCTGMLKPENVKLK